MTVSEGPASDRRPVLHLTSPEGWLNDPLGITYRRGRYHAFYQSVPAADRWHPSVSWGHATSTDLLTWTPHPSALVPGDGDLGCWSGDVLVSRNEVGGSDVARDGAVLFYTSVNEPDLHLGSIRTARPMDGGWLRWEKGPVVVRPPDEGWQVFRDPSVFRDGSVWRMLVGAGHRDGRAAVLSFTSVDLSSWTYAGTVAERPAAELDPRWTATAWECPHLVPMGDRHVLLVSVWAHDLTRYVAAGVGTYADGRMAVHRWSRLTYGPGHYAASPFVDADGERCVVFWIRDVAATDGSWSGAVSLPYRLRLDPAGEVELDPHPVVRVAAGLDLRRALALDWLPQPASSVLELRDARAGTIARLTGERGLVQVETAAARVDAPLGERPLQVVVDDVVLEVCTGRAVIGLAVPAAGRPMPTPTEKITSWWRGDGAAGATPGA